MVLGYALNTVNIAEQTQTDDLTRARRIRDAWLAYQGEQPKPLKNEPGQPDDNVCVNLARLSVDTTVFFLFGKDLAFEIADDEQESPGSTATDAETEADVYLENVWKANKQQTFLLKVGLNGAVCGHAFLKIVAPKDGGKFPRLVNLDPACMRVEFLPDDIEEVYRYTYTYTANDPVRRKAMVYRQTTEQEGDRWVVIDAESEPDGTRWHEVARTPWPFDWPPVIDCQNLPSPNVFWGISDLESDVRELGDSANFVLSNTNRILRYHAHPKTLGKGFDAKNLRTAADGITVLPSVDANIWNLEMQSDLASSLAHYARVKSAYHETTQVPEVTTGKFDNIGQLSGLALQILYGPILQRTEVKRRTYGDMLTELNRRLLAYGGYGEENDVTTQWPELLPSDPQAEATTLRMHQGMGVVSTHTVSRKLGYDPELEGPKMEAEAAAAATGGPHGADAQPDANGETQNIQQDVASTF